MKNNNTLSNNKTKNSQAAADWQSAAGFTLLEIVLAMMILVLLLGSGYRVLSAIGRGQTELKEQRDLQSAAVSIMNRLTREIQLATDTSKLITPEMPYFLHSVDRQDGDFPADEIKFMANGAGQQLSDGFFNSGLVEISYRLLRDPEEPSNPWLTLVREEIPNKKPFETAFEERVLFPLHNRIAGLDFQFYSKEKEKWDTRWADENTLPNLVQITLDLVSISDQVHTYTTTVKIK